MPKFTSEEITNSEKFVKVEELDHDDIAPFVLQNMRAQNPFTILFKLFLVIIGSTVTAQLIIFWAGLESLLGFLAGILLLFTAGIIVHEVLHLIAYALLGARKLAIVPKWSQGAVVAAADGFVLAKNGFYFLAMTPFIVLTASGIYALFLITDPFLYAMTLSFLLFHTLACIGDFGLASYFYEQRRKKIFTFDDMVAGKSYFYEQISEPVQAGN